ncbi:MAG: protein kinase [Planctomycetes bacterium]|nr:protein kinase [Planctomycetota bacterium]
MAVPDLPLGTRLGKYRITGRLGQGGMAIVYAGEDTHLGRPVAIKLLAMDVAYASRGRGVTTLLAEAVTPRGGNKTFRSPSPAGPANHPSEWLSRFLLEARAAARLNHPHVVTVHDIGQHHQALYLVMELLGGGSVQARLKAQGPLPWQEATRIMAEVCRGLVAAHAAGLIHRDIKPSNILLANDGTAKLADFGLAKAPALLACALTQPGTLLGTPQYMSPEHCTGEPLDPRTDLYSLGAAYYTLLVGQAPFDGDDPAMILYAHCSAPVPDPRTRVPDLPAPCSHVIARAMAKARADRFADAAEMLRHLLGVAAVFRAPAQVSSLAAPPPATRLWNPVRRSRRSRWFTWGLAGLALGVAGLGLFLGRGYFRAGPKLGPQAEKLAHPLPANAHRRLLLRPRVPALAGHQGEATAVSIAGTRLASAGSDGQVHIWNLPSSSLQKVLHYPGALQAVALSPDSHLVAAGGEMNSIFFWDPLSGEGLRPVPGFPGKITALAFAPSGQQLAVATEHDLQLLDLGASAQVSRRSRLLEQVYVVSSVAFSRDGTRLAACLSDGSVHLWELPTLKHQTTPDHFPGLLTGVAVSDDGATVAIGSHEGIVRLWQPGTPPAEWHENAGCITSLVFAPGCPTLIVAGEWSGPLRVCDLAAGQTTRLPVDLNGVVKSLSFAPDGRTLAAACADGKIRLWEATWAERQP